MPGNSVRFSATLDDKVSTGLQKIADKFDLLGGKGSAASLFGNVGAKAVAVGFGLIEEAGSKVVDILGQSVDAARKDEASIADLGAALKANVPNWNGDTAAIEATITARQRLGFTNEEQRSSLALLVGATHDSTKALDLQRVAMDLAVRKHISLADAGEALTKVEAGSYRILKGLGIVLKDGATQADALAAVEKVVGGAAEDLANTNDGKLRASQVKVNEAMVKLGTIALPLVADGMVTIADAAVILADDIKQVVDIGQKLSDWADSFAGSAANAAGETDILGSKTDGLGGALHGVWDALINSSGGMTAFAMATKGTASVVDSDGRGMAASLGSSFDTVGTASHAAAARVDTSMKQITDAFSAARAKITGASKGFADSVYDPLIAKAQLALNQIDIAETQHNINSGKLRGKDLLDATVHLDELKKTQMDLLATLASYGDKSASDALQHQIDVLQSTKHLTKEQIAYLHALEDELDVAKQKAKDLAEALISSKSSRTGNAPRAGGGPVMAGQTYTVGEQGPETLVMSGGGGYVIPNTGGSSGGGGASITIHASFPSLVPPSVSQMQQAAKAFTPELVRELRRQGIL